MEKMEMEELVPLAVYPFHSNLTQIKIIIHIIPLNTSKQIKNTVINLSSKRSTISIMLTSSFETGE